MDSQSKFTNRVVVGVILFQEVHEASWKQRDSQQFPARSQPRLAEVQPNAEVGGRLDEHEKAGLSRQG